MSSHSKRIKKTKQYKQKRKPIKQVSSSSDDEQTNYAEQIEQFKGGKQIDEDNEDDEAEINKLILKHVEPVFSKPTFDMQADVVKGRKSKTLPMNRILKNNLDINEQTEDYINVNRQVKQYHDTNVLTRNEHEEADITSEQNNVDTNANTNELSKEENTNEESDKLLLPYDLTTGHHKTITNEDVIMVYPDYSGPYKINKKVFRICYISVVVIMLITLMFIIVLQHFRGFIISKQHVEVMDSKPTMFAGGWNNEKLAEDDEQPIVNSLDNIINKQNIVIEPVKRMRDSKGRFIKVK